MKIGDVARRSGLTTKTIRYYEGIGILPEARREPNGYRAYETSTLDRIEFIKDAQAAGLSLVEIQTILDLRDEGETTCRHTIGMLESHLADVDDQLVELGRTRARLQDMIARARAMNPETCTDPNRCQTITRG
jgi:DNA-binding transcriptional MerR regulator